MSGLKKRRQGKVLTFAVSTALLAAPAMGACGGEEDTVNEPAPDPNGPVTLESTNEVPPDPQPDPIPVPEPEPTANEVEPDRNEAQPHRPEISDGIVPDLD